MQTRTMIENAADRKDSSRSKIRTVPYAQAQNDGKSRVGLTMAGSFSGSFGSQYTMVGQFSGPFASSFQVVGSLRVLIYSGRVPSAPPRVPSGPRLDWSGPTPRLGFTKILQWGRGGGGTLSSRWDGSNIVVQTLLQTGYLPEQPQTSYDPKCAHCHMHRHTHTHTQND